MEARIDMEFCAKLTEFGKMGDAAMNMNGAQEIQLMIILVEWRDFVKRVS